jgi:hypothetical protein
LGRDLYLAGLKDWRLLFIKGYDNEDNMLTIDGLKKPEKRLRCAIRSLRYRPWLPLWLGLVPNSKKQELWQLWEGNFGLAEAAIVRLRPLIPDAKTTKCLELGAAERDFLQFMTALRLRPLAFQATA